MCRIIHEITSVIETHLLATWVKFPASEEEKSTIKQQ